MLSIRQYKEKIKTFIGLKKFIRIQKIIVLKDISRQNKIIEQLFFRNKIFNNILIDLYKKQNAIESSFFNSKKNKVPIMRNLHFIMSDDFSSNISQYSNKLVIEHIKKNHKPIDIYVVVGKQISQILKEEGFNIIQTIDFNPLNDNVIYEKIANKVIRGYKKMMFVKSTFIYFDLSNKIIQEKVLLPFSEKKFNFKDNDVIKSLAIENKIMKNIKINKTIWLKNIDQASDKLLLLAIREKTYYIMTQYKLDSKLRELKELEDKKNNIEEEITKINLKIQKLRQNSITNELLVNVITFKLRNKKRGDN